MLGEDDEENVGDEGEYMVATKGQLWLVGEEWVCWLR